MLPFTESNSSFKNSWAQIWFLKIYNKCILHFFSYNKDGDKIHQCALCSYVSTNSSNLARHVESFHIPHKCRYCPSVVKGRRELSDHLKHIHKSKITLRDYFNHNEPAPMEDNSEVKNYFKDSNTKRI